MNDISGGSSAVNVIFDTFFEAYKVLDQSMNRLEDQPPKEGDVRSSLLGSIWGGNYESFDIQREQLRRLFDAGLRYVQ